LDVLVTLVEGRLWLDNSEDEAWSQGGVGTMAESRASGFEGPAGQSVPLVIVVGAHPDDIEIGAAGTVRQLREASVDVLAVVVTDEADPEVAAVRRAESSAALRLLGVRSNRIRFLGVVDGLVKLALPDVAAALGALRAGEASEPAVVITHSEHDHHPDHRSVLEAVERSMGETDTVLSMCIVNSVTEGFAPSVLVETTDAAQMKAAALDAFPSQDVRGRIRREEIAATEARFGSVVGVARAEGFELVRVGDPGRLAELPGLWFVHPDRMPHPRGGANIGA
jgi:LmbE family N-acetylglucosaminyl deacetylase